MKNMKYVALALGMMAMFGANSSFAAPVSEADVIALVKADGGDCLTCHSVGAKVVGPAWDAVSERYNAKIEAGEPESQVENFLVHKITMGGNGNWNMQTGGMFMISHHSKPTQAQLHQIVKMILKLKAPDNQ